jgi:transposase-like protein
MDKQEQLLSELKQISEQYANEVSGKRRAWPKSIRERVIAARREKISFERISEATGIPLQTMYSWRIGKQRASAFLPVRVAPKASYVQQPLLESRKARPGRRQPTTVVVVVGLKLRIEGLSLEQAILVARRFS